MDHKELNKNLAKIIVNTIKDWAIEKALLIPS